jgi:hypothetical protein
LRFSFICTAATIFHFSNTQRGRRPLAWFHGFPFILLALLAIPQILQILPSSIAMSVPSTLPSKIPDLKQSEIDNLHSLATAWAGLNGLVVMRPTGIQVAPISLLPMPFPRRVYKQVNEVMVRALLDATNPLVLTYHAAARFQPIGT